MYREPKKFQTFYESSLKVFSNFNLNLLSYISHTQVKLARHCLYFRVNLKVIQLCLKWRFHLLTFSQGIQTRKVWDEQFHEKLDAFEMLWFILTSVVNKQWKLFNCRHDSSCLSGTVERNVWEFEWHAQKKGIRSCSVIFHYGPQLDNN